MKEHIRAHIRINSMNEAMDFVSKINTDGTADKLMIEDFEGRQRVNARSIIGVMYAVTDFNDNMFFVNDTNNGNFPSVVDIYRI